MFGAGGWEKGLLQPQRGEPRVCAFKGVRKEPNQSADMNARVLSSFLCVQEEIHHLQRGTALLPNWL